jgi:hypothetical protein
MAVLTERQTKAAQLAAELGRCRGTWVVSPLPLNDDSRALRFQVLDSERDSVVTELCAAGWIPSFVQAHPRFAPSGLIPASLFEVIIDKDRYPVPPDTPKVSGEIGKREKTPAEVEAIHRYLGWSANEKT